MLDLLQQQSREAAEMLSDFRKLAQLSEGEIHRETCSIRELVDEVLEPYQGQLKRLGAEVVIEELPTLTVYPSILKLLFRNLIENALKYGQLVKPRISITCDYTERGYILGVRNRGSYIEASKRKEIFKAHFCHREDRKGSGMGLAICKKIIERHQGEIWVESSSNETHFKFTTHDR